MGDGITAKWSSAVEAPKETAATTLVKGDGDAVADGDTVSTYLWVGNGTAQEQVFSDYDNGAPESIPNDPDQLGAVFAHCSRGRHTAPESPWSPARARSSARRRTSSVSIRPTAW